MTKLEKAEHIVKNKSCKEVYCELNTRNECPIRKACDMYPGSIYNIPAKQLEAAKDYISAHKHRDIDSEIAEAQARVDALKKERLEEEYPAYKWVGKMCWFWDSGRPANQLISFLEELQGTSSFYRFKSMVGLFDNCRPVTPEEAADLIYKE